MNVVKHALLDLHVYHALNIRLPCVLKKLTHVLRMLHIFLCSITWTAPLSHLKIDIIDRKSREEQKGTRPRED